jgi:methylmalonyl-CoA mutase N-terminal domain/subunit
VLFRDIPLDRVTTSMTINCTASVALAMYLALADKQGVSWDKLGGTMQNDMLKEFIAQKEWISPPESAVRIVVDTIEFCARHVPRFNPVSISGYHIREAGSTAVQELAFTLADGFGYVDACIKRGLDVDSFAPRLSFFFDIHNDFFEEIAKLRAARRIWATVMRDRFGARQPESMRLRTHTQTAGVSATAQQPLNNVARVAVQALAAVLGGAQSLHTNSYDEVLALPTEEAVTVALRTQQIIAEETGAPLTIDPLGGSYFLETLTDQMEAQAMAYIRTIDELGGMVRAIDRGYPQKEIADAAYRYQLLDDRGDKVVVGVNKYVMDDRPMAYHKIDDAIEHEQVARVVAVKAGRDAARVEKRLKQLAEACRNGGNVMPVLVDAVKDYVSLGEISDVYRQVFGLYREPIIFDECLDLPSGARARRSGSQPRRQGHDRAHQDHAGDDAQDQAEGRRARLRADLHRPHVRRRLPGREGLVRSAHRAVWPARPRPRGGGAALLAGHLRRAQGLPRRRRQGAAVPPAEARGAADPFGQADVHPAARRRPGLQSIIQLVGVEREWVPKTVGTSLYVRPTIIASEAFLGVRPAKSYIYFIILSPVGAYYPEGMAPVKIRVEEKYVRAVDGGLGGVKAGANYAASLMAGEEAKHAGYTQVLWLDGVHRKYIDEVGTMNIMVRIGDEVVTPPLSGTILPGVTRDSVLALLRKWGLKASERQISIDDVIHAHRRGALKEVFGTGTAAVISPVGELAYKAERMIINDGTIGPLTQRLYDAIVGIQYGQAPDPDGWTVEV